MTDKNNILKGPKENHLYFTHDFGFVIKQNKIETYFRFIELEGRVDDFIIYPIRPDAAEFIDEFILWAEEKGFDFNIHEKEDYELTIKDDSYILTGRSLLCVCSNECDVNELTSYMEKFWKHKCRDTSGNFTGFSKTLQYFNEGK